MSRLDLREQPAAMGQRFDSNTFFQSGGDGGDYLSLAFGDLLSALENSVVKSLSRGTTNSMNRN